MHQGGLHKGERRDDAVNVLEFQTSIVERGLGDLGQQLKRAAVADDALLRLADTCDADALCEHAACFLDVGGSLGHSCPPEPHSPERTDRGPIQKGYGAAVTSPGTSVARPSKWTALSPVWDHTQPRHFVSDEPKWSGTKTTPLRRPPLPAISPRR